MEMKFTEFIKDFQKELNENGIRISQDKLKTIFDVLGDYVIKNIGYVERIPLKEFLVFELVKVVPKKLPNGNMSDEQYSIKIRMTEGYKKRLKDELNK
jgi:nucleoid DNA-binding protein